MLGSRNYRLPSAKRKQVPEEVQEPIEINEDQVIEEVPFTPLDEDIQVPDTYEFVEEVVEQSYGEDYDDDYYFEDEEEPLKVETQFNPIIESNREDVATLADIERLASLAESDKQADSADKAQRGYHARDESLPMFSPPGFVWSTATVQAPDFWTRDGLLNFLGIGDSSVRFRERSDEEELVPPDYFSFFGGDTDAAKVEWLETKKKELEERKKLRQDVAEGNVDPAWADLPQVSPIDSLEAVESMDGTPGWMFWYGPRWQHWWHGYESPTSLTGYPVQWFYRFVHLLSPSSYDKSFKYEKDYGEIDWLALPKKLKWVVLHPCTGQIIMNMLLITPLAFYMVLRPRLKIIRNRIKFGRTVLTRLRDHMPIILRRLRLQSVRRVRRRYWRWTAFFTFAFAPNCWDLTGHHNDDPTDDWWQKNYIKKFTDGIQTSEYQLKNWNAHKPTINQGITTKPNLDALRQYEQQAQQEREQRQNLRKELFDLEPQQTQQEWSKLFQTERQLREAQIQEREALAAAQRTKTKMLNQKDSL